MEDFLLILFFSAIAIQGIYFLFIFPSILFHKTGKATEYKGISVIIAAHNEKKNLQKLVPLLLNQKYPDFEVIIADDRSTDGSADYLSGIQDTRLNIVRIDKVPADYNAKKFALKEAIHKSGKELLLLTDADCFPVSDIWIVSMAEKKTPEKDIVLGYSPYQKESGFLNLFIRFESFFTAVQYLSFACIGLPYMGVGRNLVYSRKLFEKKGFKKIKSITGGDDDLFVGDVATGKNTTICIDREACIYSVPKKRFWDFFRQKTRHLAVGTRYSLANKLKTGFLPVSQFLLYFSFIMLIFLNVGFSAIFPIFILRTLVIIVIFVLIARKLGETINWFWFPVLDLSYLIYYIVTGIPAVFTRNNIKWK